MASSPKRKSGLHAPASGALGSNRKSKLQTPARRKVSRLSSIRGQSNSDASKNSDKLSLSGVVGVGGVSASDDVPEPVKRSLDESSSFLPDRKKTFTDDATNGGKSPTRRRKSSAASPMRSSSVASDAQKFASRRKSNVSSILPSSSFSSSSSSSSTAASPAEKEEAVKVCVRIKPLFEEEGNEPRAFVLGPMENTIIKNAEGSDGNAYQFNNVYGETSSTQQLYDDMVHDVVESVGQGRNGTIFTYGQTSTGKTYTMHGILVAAGRHLFGMATAGDGDGDGDDDERIDRDPASMAGSSTSLTSIRISCMELYNEELRDLLCPSTASLSIQEDRRGNVQIPNLTERVAANTAELMAVIQIAEENRTVASTAINERSSRSHTIFRITYVNKEASNTAESLDESAMEAETRDAENNNVRGTSHRSSQKVITTVSTLNLVDLAGSESVRVTGAKGERQKEGGKINQSLLTLSRVLAKLGKKDRGHINYRDSKLTRILKPSLSGNARMGCICCISPAIRFSEESKSTLDFASRTMLVTTNAKSNRTVEYDDALVKEFEREIERVKLETAKAEDSRLQMEQSLQCAEDQIACLRATVEFEKNKVTRLESGKCDFSTQLEKLKSFNEKNTARLLKEIIDLKACNQQLESDLAQCNSEKNRLEEQRQQERDAFSQEKERLEESQAMLTENHMVESRRLQDEAKKYKESNEETKAMCKEMKAELESNMKELHNELHNLRSNSKVSDEHVAELDVAKRSLSSSQDEVVTLKNEVAVLTWKLEKEMQKAQKRKEEARHRRQKFKGKLVGMTEILKEDLVQLSYQKDF